MSLPTSQRRVLYLIVVAVILLVLRFRAFLGIMIGFKHFNTKISCFLFMFSLAILTIKVSHCVCVLLCATNFASVWFCYGNFPFYFTVSLCDSGREGLHYIYLSLEQRANCTVKLAIKILICFAQQTTVNVRHPKPVEDRKIKPLEFEVFENLLDII